MSEDMFYVGERSLWKYKRSGWGLIIPRIDADRLHLTKNTVARMYVNYDTRTVMLKFVDVRKASKKEIEEAVIDIVDAHKDALTTEDIDALVEKLKTLVEKKKTRKKEISAEL